MHLHILKHLADGNFCSGDELGARFGISRTAVWTHLKRLQSIGIEIDAVSGKGYRLPWPLELLQRERIHDAISPAARHLLNALELHDEIDSTPAAVKIASDVGQSLSFEIVSCHRFRLLANRFFGQSKHQRLYSGAPVLSVLSSMTTSGKILRW